MNTNENILDQLSEISRYSEDEILYVAYLVSNSYNETVNSNYKTVREMFKGINYDSVYTEPEHSLSFENIYDSLLRFPHTNGGNGEHEIEELEEIGSGSFSEVYKVKFDGEIRAIKKMHCGEADEGLNWSDIRELSVLKLANSSNIVNCEYVSITSNTNKYGISSCTSVVIEYLPYDLQGYIYDDWTRVISKRTMKRFSLQLFNAVKYLNDLGIIHGDIKPQNILVKGEDIKLADFGLIQLYITRNDKLAVDVYTRWYRPIEILLDDQSYYYGADVWASGCTIAEMITIRPLFPEDSELKEIYKILEYLGTNEVEPYLNSLYGWKKSFPVWKGIQDMDGYKRFFRTEDETLIDLLTGMIDVPQKRLTIEECINHPWVL